MSGSSSERVHVAVGVILNDDGEVLITRRAKDTHQGDLWEFPGGKLETGESVQAALVRELKEELGIQVQETEPLIRIHHDYPDKSVLLDVRRVSRFQGTARGREGQPLRWLEPGKLTAQDFPAANAPIIKALQLPHEYLITGKFSDRDDFIRRLQAALDSGIRLLQFRPRTELSEQAYADLVEQAVNLSRRCGARVLLNTSIDEFEKHDADGLHMNSDVLMACEQRPIGEDKWLSASVHNEAELAQANNIGVDFIMLSPVLPTQSHPGAPTLGWDRFYALTEKSFSPVFALGGMDASHLEQAREKGAQGIAAITAFWSR